jgi:L-ascorbate metabolism protein UlaG (beta-lactamase superfamily)
MDGKSSRRGKIIERLIKEEEAMRIEEIVRKIHWLGHDTIRIEGSSVVCFDPYQISSSQPADIILITHEHFDHCSPEDVVKVQKDDTIIVTDAVSAKKLEGDIKVVSAGEQLQVKGVEIEVREAYNTNKDFHPKSAGMLSFVVTLDGIRYYHAGDTDFIPEMKGLQVDVAFLPVSGTYVMTADEAVEAARAIKPKLAIPMHYASIVGSEEDARKFKDALEGEIPVVILSKET